MKAYKFIVISVIVMLLGAVVAACSPTNSTAAEAVVSEATSINLQEVEATSINLQEVETILIQEEEDKWDRFARGEFNTDIDLFTDDFINIGWYPTGVLRQTKEEAFAAIDPSSAEAPPPMVGQIALSEFIVLHPNDGSAIVTYQVDAPFAVMYVTSVWALRDSEWKTVFYQVTPISTPPMESAAPTAEAETAAFEIPFFGRYLTEGVISTYDALLLNPDGTYAVDFGASGEYGTTGRFEINGNVMTFTDDERTDVPECRGDQRVANYQFSYTGDTLTLISMDDTCPDRRTYFDGRLWEK